MVDLFLREITEKNVALYNIVVLDIPFLRVLRYDRDGAMDWLSAPCMWR